jgi:hypothetical protein
MTTKAKFVFDTLNFVLNEQKQDRITADALYETVKTKVDTNVASFKVELASWLSLGIIKGFKAVKGRYGGLYPDGQAEFFANLEEDLIKSKEKPEKPAKSELPSLDPTPIGEFILTYLQDHARITVGELITMVSIAPLTEAQFKFQMSQWLNDGHTFPLLESRKGPTGGIYLIGTVSEKRSMVIQTEDGEEVQAEHSNGFAVQVSPTVKILHSDDRNWVIQKLSGNTWVNRGYHPDIVGCLRSAVKHAVNGEFNCVNQVVQLKDLANVFEQIEGRLMGQLKGSVPAEA